MEIKLDHLVKVYDKNTPREVCAVRDISLEIPSKGIFGIIGKSGAGKSTLVRLVSLLERPDSGEVIYGEQRVDNLSEGELILRRRRLGMIFQNFNLFSSRTAGQNIAYPLEICSVPKAIIHKRVEELLSLVGLSDRADAAISTLSGGQKQRIAIARALANNPDILFCDEATSALDPQTTHSILDLIRTIQREMNLTVVMITHQMEVVRDACSSVAVLNEGQVVEQGSVEDIFLHPSTEITREFLSNLTQPVPVHTPKEDMVRWSTHGGKYTLRFNGSLTDEPVLSQLARNFSIEFNIRAGGIQNLSDHKVGTLVTDITGDDAEVRRAIAYLRSTGIIVEYDGVEE